ncbi:MAG: JAB domain-containing protein [Patescibacteria group bacterium]|jgi:DNA repair protein RadC
MVPAKRNLQLKIQKLEMFMDHRKQILEIREQMTEYGATGVNDIDLLMSSLAVDKTTAKRVLAALDENFDNLNVSKLKEQVGNTTGNKIVAFQELFRRRYKPSFDKIIKPTDALKYIQHYAQNKQEHLIVILLNGACEVIKTSVITIGLLDRSLAHPREVFAEAVNERAANIIIAHNHPSGQLSPSNEDRKLTIRLQQAGELLGIPLIDHLIFSTKGHYSFKEHGEL